MIDPLLQVDWPLEPLWSSTTGFIAIFVTVTGVLGLGSRSMTIGALSAYTMFVYFATTVNNPQPILTNLMYLSLVLVCVGLGFKVIRLEAWGE